jgi:hypothetical protein
MGYTHYWTRAEGLNHSPEQWKKFVAACKKLHKNMPEHSLSSGGEYENDPLVLNGCWKYEKPQLTQEHILFNGGNTYPRKKLNDEWIDTGGPQSLGHETFYITRNFLSDTFNFCKTARKPYDLMVQACLILYKYYFPEVKISSDGDKEDWAEAFKFVLLNVSPYDGVEITFQIDSMIEN